MADILQRHFNIHKALEPFISEITSFRSLQAQTNALISGVFALNFLESSSSEVAILDLLVEAGGDEEILVNYVTGQEAYKQEEDWENTMVRDKGSVSIVGPMLTL